MKLNIIDFFLNLWGSLEAKNKNVLHFKRSPILIIKLLFVYYENHSSAAEKFGHDFLGSSISQSHWWG